MEIKELKTKLKVTFPEESEIFMAEEFLEVLHGADFGSKPVELDFSSAQTFDTVFFQIAVSIVKAAKGKGAKVTLKSGEAFERAAELYGVDFEGLAGGDA
jgi:anti-anti-sigma regulatory factor